jgi:hypothetical protein
MLRLLEVSSKTQWPSKSRRSGYGAPQGEFILVRSSSTPLESKMVQVYVVHVPEENV